MAPEGGSVHSGRSGGSLVLSGIAGSPGVAIGRALVVDTRRPAVVKHRIGDGEGEAEMQRFRQAASHAAATLRETADHARGSSARAEASILEAYVMMVEDETLRAEVERRVLGEQHCAEWAVDEAISVMAAQLRATRDPYLSERSHDFEFVGDRILRALSGRTRMQSLPPGDDPVIVIAHDLSPAETAGFSRERVRAIVTEGGTRTSHTAILARALEIPAVLGVGDVLSHVTDGELVVVDGLRGRVVLSPTGGQLDEATGRAQRHQELTEGRTELRHSRAVTACGVAIAVRANIELPGEAPIALELGAEGIGLYRTEFLYVDRLVPPDEEEQYEIYRGVLATLAPLPVTLRTFDLGGDKFSSALEVPEEMNPALGLRAVRLGLARPEILMTQLRAMLRASAHGVLRILIPMISTLDELRAVRLLLDAARADVRAEGHPLADSIPLGIMIEVPSAAIMADRLAREADFMSIGTNDLVQYALAVDRTNAALASLASYYDPSIVRLIDGVVAAGAAHGRPVSVCGTMASDPYAAALLVGMGLRELSMEASSLSAVKQALGRLSCAELREMAASARACSTAADVEAVLARGLAERLADLAVT